MARIGLGFFAGFRFACGGGRLGAARRGFFRLISGVEGAEFAVQGFEFGFEGAECGGDGADVAGASHILQRLSSGDRFGGAEDGD